MESQTKYVVGGIALITTGLIVSSRAEKLTTIENGVELPNEGGYIRSKISGIVLVGVGIAFLGYVILKK